MLETDRGPSQALEGCAAIERLSQGTRVKRASGEEKRRMNAVLFRNVTIWDGIGDAPYPGEVVVEGNRIRAVARGRNQIASERAAEIIDGQGMMLIPGLVEGHCHLSFVGVNQKND